MKITKRKLKQIIKEEIESALNLASMTPRWAKRAGRYVPIVGSAIDLEQVASGEMHPLRYVAGEVPIVGQVLDLADTVQDFQDSQRARQEREVEQSQQQVALGIQPPPGEAMGYIHGPSALFDPQQPMPYGDLGQVAWKRDDLYAERIKQTIDEELINLLTEQERDRYGNEIWYDDGEAIPVDPATGRDVSYGGYSGFDPSLVGPEHDYQSMARGGYTGMSGPMPAPPERTISFEDEDIRGERPEPEPWRPVTPQQEGWAYAREQAERLEREAEESPQAGRQGDEETLRLP